MAADLAAKEIEARKPASAIFIAEQGAGDTLRSPGRCLPRR
jgi:hypothetical protein